MRTWIPRIAALCALGLTTASLVINFIAWRSIPPPTGQIEGSYIDFTSVLDALNALLTATVAVVILFNRPSHRIAWILLAIALSLGLSGFSLAYAYLGITQAAPLLPALSWAAWASQLAWPVAFLGLISLLLLFPTGHHLTPRWRWILVVSFITVTLAFFLLAAASPITIAGDEVPNPLGGIPIDTVEPILLACFLVIMVVLAAALAGMIIRYARARGVERLQSKWLLFVAALFTFAQLFSFLTGGSAGRLLVSLAAFCFPVAIGAAILRYRLWEIDVIIRRTLVYVPLTAVLAGIFAASIKVLQALLGNLADTDSEAVTALTTLIIVAAFDPIKRWLQATVDARFKDVPNPTVRWVAFGDQVRQFTDLTSPAKILNRLLDEAVAVFCTEGGKLLYHPKGRPAHHYSVGESAAIAVTIPLQHHGLVLGELSLSARRNGRPFDSHDLEMLNENVGAVAEAVALVTGRSGRGQRREH